MSRNIWQKCGGAEVILAGAVVLVLALGVRYGLLESGVLPRDCDGRMDLACAFKWTVVQTFVQQRLGWISLVCGLVALLGRRRLAARIGWISGLAGLVLYSFDYAAVGAMLSLLVLLRPAAEDGGGEEQAGQEPGDGLWVGGLH